MKEYEVVREMSEGYSNRYSKILEAIIAAINNKHYEILNFQAAKSRVEEAMNAVELKMRFDELNNKALGKLTASKTEFELDGHKFETLDDVEKALKNKAFL